MKTNRKLSKKLFIISFFIIAFTGLFAPFLVISGYMRKPLFFSLFGVDIVLLTIAVFKM